MLLSMFKLSASAQQKKAASKKPVSVFLNEYRAGLMSSPKADTNWFVVERKKEIERWQFQDQLDMFWILGSMLLRCRKLSL